MRTERQKTYVTSGGPGQTHLEQEGTSPKSQLSHSGEGPSLPLDHSSAWVTCDNHGLQEAPNPSVFPLLSREREHYPAWMRTQIKGRGSGVEAG